MEKRIDLEKRGRSANQIRELNLDNCRSTSIVGLTDDFTNLESLSLINVGLTTLKGFPKLPNLKKLELSDNRISNGLNLLSTSPKLQYLNLSGNRIKDFEALQPLQELSNLKNLDLFNNEATVVEDYRVKIFELIPSLKYLDGYDIEEKEQDSDGDNDEDDEVNGNDDESEEEEDIYQEGVSDDEDDEEEEADVSLSAVYKENLEEESDVDDYEEEEGEEDDDEDGLDGEEEEGEDEEEEVEEAESPARGKKRKHEDGDTN